MSNRSSQKGGGSVGQSLQYVDTSAPERSAPAGHNLLVERGLTVRPAIGGSRKGSRKTRASRKKRGGFYPSVMSGVVTGGVVLAPMAAFAARKLLTRKNRRGGGKMKKRKQTSKKNYRK